MFLKEFHKLPIAYGGYTFIIVTVPNEWDEERTVTGRKPTPTPKG